MSKGFSYPINARRDALVTVVCSIAVFATFLAAWTCPSAAAQKTLHAFDLQRSTITVYVYKKGLFAFLADNHEIAAPLASGSYDSVTKQVQLRVNASQMRVLDPALSPGTRSSVQSNMLGPQVLDVAKYPVIAFRSTAIVMRDPTHWNVRGDLTLHGQTHPVDVAVTRTGRLDFTGSASVSQRAFGITPIRVAGGAVSVRNAVRVTFHIVLR